MVHVLYCQIFLLQAADGPKETCLNCNEMFDLATLPTHLRSCQDASRSPRIDVPDDDLEDFEPIRVRFRIPGRLCTNHPSRTVVRFPLLLHHMLEYVALNRKFSSGIMGDH